TGDLRHPALLRRKLSHLRERKQAEVESLGPIAGTGAERERGVFTSPDLPERWRTAATRLAGLGLVVPDTTLAAFMAKARSVVFEGAQGVLLDEQAGFHPFTTWSRCTPGNAWELLAEAAPGTQVQTIGVLRSHAVRHGPGPLPTESAEPRPAIFDHNRLGEWQGPVRYGWFDPVLARYALAVAGPLDRIVLTHLDAPARLGRWRVCIGYEMPAVEPGDADLIAVRDAAGRVTRLAAPAAP